MGIKIFVFQHMLGLLPSCFADRSIYVPIQCGRAIHDAIPDIIGDDTGDNISALNREFNEMTAMYWIAKHYEEIGDPEYVGVDHYRRYLNWSESMLSPRTVIARRWFSWRPLRGQYACCHDINDLDAFSARFKQEFAKEEYNDYDAYWRTHFFYICNMFVMHRDDFKRYSKFIVKCIDILKEIKVGDSKDPMARRAPGYILETMTSYWIWHEKRRKQIKVIPSHITHFNIENKANGGRCVSKRGFLWFLRQAY